MPELYGTGNIPVIACVNQATKPLGVDFAALVAAMQQWCNDAFAPVWGTPCQLVVNDDVPDGCWGMVWVDDAGQAGAAGFHEVTPAGLPQGFVDVGATLSAGMTVGEVSTHELGEMLADPDTATLKLSSDGIYIMEVCDAVQEDTFDVNGVPCSNFVTPAWFESFWGGNGVEKPADLKFDYLGHLSAPYQLLPSGYISRIAKNGQWTQDFGSKRAAEIFKVLKSGEQCRPQRRKTAWLASRRRAK